MVCYNVNWRLLGSMFVASLTREEKNIYGLYNRFRQCFVNANINTLRQICIYICRSGFNGDIYKDIVIKYNNVWFLQHC